MEMFYFNPRAPYGARRDKSKIKKEEHVISIHAPHTGRDCSRCKRHHTCRISIHAPHTGRDEIANPVNAYNAEFQSTRPIRGATTTQM